MKRSPGQYAPWIEDPDPPEEPMTPEQIKAASAASKDLVERAMQEQSSSKLPPDEPDRMFESVVRGLMRDKGFTREQAEDAAENFY